MKILILICAVMLSACSVQPSSNKDVNCVGTFNLKPSMMKQSIVLTKYNSNKDLYKARTNSVSNGWHKKSSFDSFVCEE